MTDVFPIVNERTRAPVEDPAGKVLQTGALVGLANHTVLLARSGPEVPISDSAAPIRLPERIYWGTSKRTLRPTTARQNLRGCWKRPTGLFGRRRRRSPAKLPRSQCCAWSR